MEPRGRWLPTRAPKCPDSRTTPAEFRAQAEHKPAAAAPGQARNSSCRNQVRRVGPHQAPPHRAGTPSRLPQALRQPRHISAVRGGPRGMGRPPTPPGPSRPTRRSPHKCCAEIRSAPGPDRRRQPPHIEDILGPLAVDTPEAAERRATLLSHLAQPSGQRPQPAAGRRGPARPPRYGCQPASPHRDPAPPPAGRTPDPDPLPPAHYDGAAVLHREQR